MRSKGQTKGGGGVGWKSGFPEGGGTHIVGFLSGVNAQMALQGLQMAKAGATGVAGVGLLTCVDQDVGSQVSHLKPGQTRWENRRQISELAVFIFS